MAGNRYHPAVGGVNVLASSPRESEAEIRAMDAESSTEDEDTFIVDSLVVSCDGGGGPLGHPKVFLHIDESGEVVCPYCSRRYVLSGDAPSATH